MVSSAVLPGQSALADIPAQSHETPKGSPGKVIIRDAGPMDLINLRCQRDNRKISAILKKLAGNGLASANQFLKSGDRAIVCLGPDEWLIMSEAGTSSTITAALETANAGHIATTEVSSAMGVLNISGKACRDLLAKHCAIDLDRSSLRLVMRHKPYSAMLALSSWLTRMIRSPWLVAPVLCLISWRFWSILGWNTG